MIYLILILLFIFIIVMLYNALISWIVHMSMVRESCTVYKKGNRKMFFQCFKVYKLKPSKYFDESFFGDDYNEDSFSCFHANIIKFNGIGMMLNIIDWHIVKYKLKKISKNMKKENILHSYF